MAEPRDPVRNLVDNSVVHGPVVQAGQIGSVTVTTAPPAPAALDGLPPAPPGLVGRTDELTRLEAALTSDGASGPVVVTVAVAGLAGVGKTALAVSAAHRVRAAFGDAVFLDLHGYDERRRAAAAEATGALLRALGVPGDAVPADTAERAALLRTRLAERARDGRRMLIVLDNVASATQVAGVLPASPAHRVLITSRHRLGGLDGARLIDIGVLDAGDAVALLAGRLRTADPGDDRIDREPDAAYALARLCGHLPLALSIAAALLIAEPERSLGEWAAELSAAGTRLTLLDDGDSRAIRATFDLSYRCLDTAERRLFRLLGLHPGAEFDAESAAGLAALPVPATRRLLTGLRRAHLIDPGAVSGTYRFHDLLRLYARDRLAAEATAGVVEEAAGRLLDHYLARTRHADGRLGDPDARTAVIAWLEGNRPTLVAAVRLAAETGHDGRVVELTASLSAFLELRAYWSDAAATAALMLDAARRGGDLDKEATALTILGTVRGTLHDNDAALACFQRALEIARETGERHDEAMALGNLGVVWHALRRFDACIAAYETALDIVRGYGDRGSELGLLNALGTAYLDLDELDDAERYMCQVRDIAREIGDPDHEAVALNNLGGVYQRTDRIADALECHRRCLRLFRARGDRGLEQTALSNLGMDLVGLDRPGDAVPYYEEALDLARVTGDVHSEAITLVNLGIAQRLLGRVADAAVRLRRGRALFQRTGDLYGEAKALDMLGVIDRDSGRTDDARAAWQAAIGLLAGQNADEERAALQERLDDLGA